MTESAHCCWCWYDAHPANMVWCHGVDEETLCREHMEEAGDIVGEAVGGTA
jgi:hypothetical protein